MLGDLLVLLVRLGEVEVVLLLHRDGEKEGRVDTVGEREVEGERLGDLLTLWVKLEETEVDLLWRWVEVKEARVESEGEREGEGETLGEPEVVLLLHTVGV